MHSLGTPAIDRRSLLRRGAALAGVSLLAFPPLALAGVDEDLAEVRLVCATKRLTIGWYTRWIDAGVASSTDAAWLPKLRRQEQQSYATLAPLLGATAPTDGDFDFAFPPGAIRSANNARTLGVSLERLALGVELGAASRISDPNVAGPVAAVAATSAMHVALLTGALSSSLPVALTAADASTQLGEYLQ
jgi:Ferritin-like domain